MIETSDPKPELGQVVVRSHFMAVGKPDVLIRQGVYKWSPPLPASPGNELVGVIDSVGEGVDNFVPGQPVLLSARELDTRGGCYAELIAVPATAIHALPDGIDLEHAVVLPTYLVAYAMLYGLGIVTVANSIFITGAAGSIASALTDLAKARGIEVIGSVSSIAKEDYASSLGVDHIINYKKVPILRSVLDITDGRGVDASFDHVIGDVFVDCIRMLGDFGVAVAYNQFSPLPEKDVFNELRNLSIRSLSIRTFNIHTYDRDLEKLRLMTRNLIKLLRAKKIRPRIGMRLPLSEAAEAHRLLESGKILGKIILTAHD
ncbi:MAG: zinc-binding dehydrogenase [Pseudomonadota bacterium]|nr:zinc-binding dehydrogenase [Pseudomonadota bacterium]